MFGQGHCCRFASITFSEHGANPLAEVMFDVGCKVCDSIG